MQSKLKKNTMKLTRNINKFTLLTTAIAGIVGSGWLLGPYAAAKIAGPAAIISWIAAGLLMMIVAYTFVVLTRSMPIAGGTVRFFQMSHGHFVGFTFAWIAWLAWVAVAPIETLALLQYAANYQPWIMTTDANGSHLLTFYGFLLAAALVISMYFINHIGMRLLSKANFLMVCLKLAIPIATVAILLTQQFHLTNFHRQHGFIPMGVQSIFAAMPLAGVIYSFIGFNPAIQLAAEVKQPKKSISFAIIGSLLICIILYALIQTAFIGALNPNDFAHGWQHLSFTGDTGPFAGIITALGIIWFVKLLYIDALISPYGTAMVQVTATSRLTYAMSLNGYFPAFLKKVNKHQVPARALIINTLLSLLFFLPFPSWQKMVGFLVSCLVFGYIVGPMSLMATRLSADKHDGFIGSKRCDMLCLAAFYVCNLIIYWTGWTTIFKVCIAFTLGYAVLLIYMLIPNKQQKLDLRIKQGWWVIPYLMGMAFISYIGSFSGGHSMVPFGWDFVLMAVFTAAIFYLAKAIVSPANADDMLAGVSH